MRRYKFKTAEDLSELWRSLKQDAGVSFSTSEAKPLKRLLLLFHAWYLQGATLVRLQVMAFTIVEFCLVCFTHKTIT